MNTKNKNYAFWENKRNKITSSVGKWVGGDDVIVHDYLMMKDLLGKISYMQMLILNVTGRLVEKRIADWLEGNFIGVSYPDARIWCNTIGALAGSQKTSIVSATVSGVLAADSRGYGGSQTSLYAMEFIQSALQQKKSGINIVDIIEKAPKKREKPIIVGYARPVSRVDERLIPHQEMTKQLGFKEGEHVKLAWEINNYLEKNYNLAMNIAGYSSAFLSDQDFTPIEIYRIKALMVASGVTACYIDCYNNSSSNSFLPQYCDDIEYIGPNLKN